MEVEKRRLFMQARKQKEAELLYDFGRFIPSYVKAVTKEYGNNSVDLKMELTFESSENLKRYIKALAERLEEYSLLRKRSGKEIKIEVEMKRINPETLEYFLDLATSPYPIHFAKEIKIRVGNLELYFYDQRKTVKNLGIPKTPWKYRLTVSASEYKILKEIIAELYSIPEISQMILLQTKRRSVASERIHILGEPVEHIRWRHRVSSNMFSRLNLKSSEDIISLLKEEDFCSFYFRPKSIVNFEDRKLDITTVNVIEFDPRGRVSEGVFKEIIKKFLHVLNTYKIPYMYGHSGSKSPRIHINIDPYSILRNLDEIESKYPYVGYTIPQKISEMDFEKKYERVIKTFNQGLLLMLMNKIQNLLRYVCWRKNEYDKGVLVDFPKSASICLGSVKSLKEVSIRERRLLEREIPKFRKYPLSRILTIATPLEENEIPIRRIEILKITNFISSVGRIKSSISKFKKKMKEKMKVYELERVLKDINEETLLELNLKTEKEFKLLHGL